MTKRLFFALSFILCIFAGFAHAGPPGAPSAEIGVSAQLTAGTDTTPRLWDAATLATQFSGAAVEIVDEAVTAANMNGDTAHGVSQNALIDYLMATIDPDGDGSIADSALSLYGLTITGSDGLHVGVAGTTKGTVRWYDNTAENVFHFDLYASNFTENWGIALQAAYPTVNNALFNVDTNGVAGWTDPATFEPALAAASQIEMETGTEAGLRSMSPLRVAQAIAALAAGGAFTGGTLTSELVIDETGIEGQPTDAISDCSSYSATGGGLFYDDSEGKWKKCQDGTLSDLDTNTGSLADLDDLPGDTVDDNLIDFAILAAITSISAVDTADENATFYPLLVDGATGVQAVETDGEMTYNPSTGRLTVPIVTAGEFESSAADGSRMSTLPDNTTGNEPSPAAGESGFYSFETYLYMYENGTKVGRVMGLTGGTNLNPDAADGAALGSATLEWSDLFLADAGVINFGADQDVTLTHVADTGLLLNAAMQLQFRDSAIYINSGADGYLDLEADTGIRFNGPVTLVNEGAITAGGIILGDSTPDAEGEIGYASNQLSIHDGTASRSLLQVASTVITKSEYLPIRYAEDDDSVTAPAAAAEVGTTTAIARSFVEDADNGVVFWWNVPLDYSAGVKYRVYYAIQTDADADETVSFALSGCSNGNTDALACTEGTAVNVADELTTDYDANELIISDWSSAVTVTNITAGEMAKLLFIRDVSEDDYAGASDNVLVIGVEVKYQAKVNASGDY